MRTPFDHLSAGTDEARWRADTRLDRLPPLESPGSDARIAVLVAHPDDETLGAGGLIATSAAAGAAIRVVVATNGEASHPHSPTHSPAVLAKTRRDEVQAAVAELAPDVVVTFLDLPDGGLADHLDDLIRLADDAVGDCTHLVSTWADDGHPDHEACATAGQRIAAGRPSVRLWQVPIWLWHWATPESPELPLAQLRRLELSDGSRRRKQAALAHHASQHSPLSPAPGDEAILPPNIVAHFERPFETFVVSAPATEPAYFDALYEQAADPWGLSERFYEQRKRALLLAALPRATFRRAFEPGCAVGLLTRDLARRSDELVAWDGAAAAVEQTRSAVAGLGSVTVEQRRIGDDWPAGEFDLIALSEVGYYGPDVDLLARHVEQSLTHEGVVVACHWRHPAPDHAVTASEVHDALGRNLHRVATHVEADFLLDVWSTDARSVAQREGIVP